MTTIINNYWIETGYGFDLANATVTEIKGVDEFGRIVFGACVYGGTWDECEEFARTH